MKSGIIWTFFWLVFYSFIHWLEVSGYWATTLTSNFAFGMSFGMFVSWVWLDYWWQKSNDLLIKKIKELMNDAERGFQTTTDFVKHLKQGDSFKIADFISGEDGEGIVTKIVPGYHFPSGDDSDSMTMLFYRVKIGTKK